MMIVAQNLHHMRLYHYNLVIYLRLMIWVGKTVVVLHVYWLLWIRCHWTSILSVWLGSFQSRWSVVSITAEAVLYYVLVNCLLLLGFGNKFLFLQRRSGAISSRYNRETCSYLLLCIASISSCSIELVLHVWCLIYRGRWRWYLIIKWEGLFMLKHHLPLHIVFIVLLYG